VAWLIRRLLSSFGVLFTIATVTFVLLRALPGGPFDEDQLLQPAVKQNMEAQYGLNKPLLEQYGRHMWGLVSGQWGYSYSYEGRAVSDLILEALPVSLQLGLYSLLLSFLVGIPLGVFSASHHRTSFDTLIQFLTVGGLSIPSFVIAPLLITFFCFGWPLNHWAPEFHQWLLDADLLLPVALWSSPRHMILPVVSLSLRPAAFIARLTRASVLDVMQSDFVRMARSKGLSESQVIYSHVLRNSLLPIVTHSGPMVAGLLSGSFVIEMIFALPGLAKYFVQGVFFRDYPLVLGLTLVFSILLVLCNLFVDLIYQWVDPRMEKL
jgi:oligopeptide transport system permease protein